MKNTDYKLGDWLIDKQTGDVYEIIKESGIDCDHFVKIGLVFDSYSKNKCTWVFNITMHVTDVAKNYDKCSKMARLLLSK